MRRFVLDRCTGATQRCAAHRPRCPCERPFIFAVPRHSGAATQCPTSDVMQYGLAGSAVAPVSRGVRHSPLGVKLLAALRRSGQRWTRALRAQRPTTWSSSRLEAQWSSLRGTRLHPSCLHGRSDLRVAAPGSCLSAGRWRVRVTWARWAGARWRQRATRTCDGGSASALDGHRQSQQAQ